MSGTKAGGLKAKAANLKRHGSDYYARIGRMGGKNGHTGGFASDPKRAQEAGRKGGLTSSRRTTLSLEERRKMAAEKIKLIKELERYERLEQEH